MKKELAGERELCAVLVGDEVFISTSQQLLASMVGEKYKISPKKQIAGHVIEVKKGELYLEFRFDSSLVKMKVSKERISLVE